tara:strand:- start:1007 stop:1762 length:756 start_codon:yes stop_codon:yes gene_type:complete
MVAWGTLFNMGTALMGASETMSASSDNSAMQAEQMQIQRELLDMARLREGYDIDMRTDQQTQMRNYQATLKNVFDRLGARSQVTPQSIQNDTNTYFDQNVNDLNNVIDRVNSQGYANQRSRGMLDSSLESDRKRELTTKYADLMGKARTDAQTRAVSKATDYENLLNTNRANITSEYDRYYSKPFDMMSNSRKTDGQGALNNAATLTNSMQTNAYNNKVRQGGAFGDELGMLRENDWNFDYDFKLDKEDDS